ncbi:hypothetical protein [Mobilicoccus caccae]|uniref:hypothetical protein n=1 Tax=Mobilicoccus caccae TaxID=1859295 RepID=UPI0024E0B94D|nr:hypothetical protein [Mobilicoccus caccae]
MSRTTIFVEAAAASGLTARTVARACSLLSRGTEAPTPAAARNVRRLNPEAALRSASFGADGGRVDDVVIWISLPES